MILHAPKTTLLYAVVASFSAELATIDDIIRKPARLPTELILTIRTHLLSNLINHFFLESTHTLATYEQDLQRLLCPDCISYNFDIYGPDIWQWQQFSGPCHCIQTSHGKFLKSSTNPQRFANPHHWLEHHLSLQLSRISPTPLPSPYVWDVVDDVLHRHHCELLREDLDDFSAIPLSGINAFYYRRVIDYYGAMKPRSPTVRIRPRPSSLRSLSDDGIGEAGEAGNAFRTDIILCQASRNLGLALELNDVFSSPRELPAPALPWASRRTDVADELVHKSTSLHFSASSMFYGIIKTYSLLSAILATFVSMPMTIATIALTIVCFYSRPIVLRVGA